MEVIKLENKRRRTKDTTERNNKRVIKKGGGKMRAGGLGAKGNREEVEKGREEKRVGEGSGVISEGGRGERGIGVRGEEERGGRKTVFALKKEGEGC